LNALSPIQLSPPTEHIVFLRDYVNRPDEQRVNCRDLRNQGQPAPAIDQMVGPLHEPGRGPLLFHPRTDGIKADTIAARCSLQSDCLWGRYNNNSIAA
jgi:hypothetical protein